MTNVNRFVITFLIVWFGPVQSFAENESRPTVILQEPANDIHDIIRLHPRVYVKQLTKTNVDGRIQYTLGGRIAGDNLVAHDAKNQTWPTQQNVAVTLTYPTSGMGKQITFVAILVDQVLWDVGTILWEQVIDNVSIF